MSNSFRTDTVIGNIPPLGNAAEDNADGVVVIKGSYFTPANGDRIIIKEGNDTKFLEYNSSVEQWVLVGILVAQGSLDFGLQLSLSDLAEFPAFARKKDPGIYFVPPAVSFTEEGFFRPVAHPSPTSTKTKIVLQTGTTNMPSTDNKLGNSFAVSESYISWGRYITAGNTAPISPVKYEIYEDTAPTDETKKIFERWLPISLWEGKDPGDEIFIDYLSSTDEAKTPIGLSGDASYYIQFSSENPFSLYGNGSELNASIEAQTVEVNRITQDRAEAINSDFIHKQSTTYFVDTTSDEVTIAIEYGTLSGFKIKDAKSKFFWNSCYVEIEDQSGSVIHTAELDNIFAKAYDFWFYDGDWYYSEEGDGEVVKVASYHKASEDFPTPCQAHYYLPYDEERDPLELPDNGDWVKVPDMVKGDTTRNFTCANGTLTKTVCNAELLGIGVSDLSANKPCNIEYGLSIDEEAPTNENITPHTFSNAAETHNISIAVLPRFLKDQDIEVWARKKGATTAVELDIKTLSMAFK